MSSNKKSSKNNKNQEIIEEEEEKEKMEIENEEEENEQEENEERDEEGMEDQEEEDKEQEENEGEEENEEEENKKEEKENDDLEDRIANIGDASLKIQNIVSILSDFKTKREEGKSRSTYMQELKNLCKSYYEYNDDICDLIFNLFPPNEAIEFMEASDSQKVLTIRTNSLKTKRRELAKNLISRGVNLDPLAEWSKVGLKIYSSSVPIGATPEYLSGQYMLQSASSFLPVLAMDPHPGDKILDMCASPGGKTTYIGQLMKNEGLLVANDFKKERIKSLFFNIHRMGIKNSIITNYDGREFAKLYNKFDRVLLDAPCSGLGVISKDKSVKMNRTYKEILNNSRLQKELILAAIDSCNAKGKGDGIIVYSTCTISVEENEWVIDYALKHRYVKCIETGIEIGEPGLVKFREKHFHPTVSNTRRIYPHIHNIDGFFIAKLKKYNDGPKIKGEIQKKEKEKKNKNRNKKKEKKNLNEENENENEKEVEEEEDENENDNNNINVDEYENN
jgi:ribosomal RNA methyltransferase Nop2